jgi:anti-sigma B factor antagonist
MVEYLIARNKQLILNFANVRLTTALLLDILVTAYKQVCDSGGHIRLSNLDSNLRKIFEVTQLTKVFKTS